MGGGSHHKKRPKTRAGGVTGGAGGGFEKQKARGSSASGAVRASGVQLKKSDVRFGNKEGGGTNFGSEERFAWQKSKYASDAMYTMPDVKAPPFSFGTSTRADWKKIMENTKDLYNPNCELEIGRLNSYFYNVLVCDARYSIDWAETASRRVTGLRRGTLYVPQHVSCLRRMSEVTASA